MIRIALACAALLAPQIANAGEYTVRIQYWSHPLQRPSCELPPNPNPKGPQPLAGGPLAVPAPDRKKAVDVAQSYLFRLQQCGFVTPKILAAERARINAAALEPACGTYEPFGSDEAKVLVTWWGPECRTP